MTTMVMSLALRKRKTLKARIASATCSGMFVGLVTGTAEKPTLRQFRTKEELVLKLQADYQSVNDMITEYHKLVAAIVISNANTTVTVCGNSYTVADAIERRNSLRMTKSFYDRISRQFSTSLAEVTNSTASIESEVSRFVTANKTEAMDALSIGELTTQTSERLIAQKVVTLCDPNDITNNLDVLVKEYTDYEDELETALNIINARTELVF